MNLIELQERLHELSQEYADEGPNVVSKLLSLNDALRPFKLVVLLSEDYDEYMIADAEEE
jgi:hypothetical protein